MQQAPTIPPSYAASIPTQDKGEQDTSMVDAIARRFVVPLALALDIAATFIRIAQSTIQLILPDVYAAWAAHTNGLTTFFYYSSNVIVIAAISIGTTASLFLTMPLLYQISTRIDAANQIKNKKIKRERLAHLREKRTAYNRLVQWAISVPLLFGASFFLAGFHWGILDIITAIADIAAPIIILYTITNSEREYKSLDPQERTMHTTTDVVIASATQIGQRFGSDTGLSIREAHMLKRGIEGDIEGMIDATIPLDPKVRYYTVTELCRKLGVSSDSRSPYRKAVQRIVERAYKAGELTIRQDEKRGAWLVPSTLYDDLFGSFDQVRADMERRQTIARTRPTRAALPAAEQSGHHQDTPAPKITDSEGAATAISENPQEGEAITSATLTTSEAPPMPDQGLHASEQVALAPAIGDSASDVLVFPLPTYAPQAS